MTTKYWNSETKQDESRPDIDAFLREIALVCKRHRMEIYAGDPHGGFEIAVDGVNGFFGLGTLDPDELLNKIKSQD